ncbi:hypothetical protein BJX76DRAFT_332340 [Aspergillus varians]
MIKAFANADGLSQLLVKTKLVKSHMSLTGFSKGFSQALDTSDFVLVGSGKDRADEKIRGIFQQFIINPTCRHVIFGACHDNGYVRVLEKYQDSDVADRVTLLLPFEPGKEFALLAGFHHNLRMETIFRNEPVTNRTSPPQTHRPLSAEVVQAKGSGKPWVAARPVVSGKPTSTSSRGLPPSGTVYVNAAKQRVDMQLPPPPPESLSSWDHKVKNAKMKYCRRYHLHASGCNGGCGYSHGPLTDGEILAYRHKLRLENCHAGGPCTASDRDKRAIINFTSQR